MCGRYTLAKKRADILAEFGVDIREEFTPRYNIAPSQPVLVIMAERKAAWVRWGLVPFWAKDQKVGYSLINARADSVATKPSFRAAFQKRRCLVLADGFYEWQKLDEKNKVPHYIRMTHGQVFAFAGIWESWRDELLSCSIVTTDANSLMQTIHQRMPVILRTEEYDRWLHGAPEAAAELMVPFAATPMEAYAVTKLVNSPHHNTVECIKAA